VLPTTSLPAGAASPNLATLDIKIAYNPGGAKPKPFDPGQPFKQYSVYIARNEVNAP
jgi:hypothetical protein